MSVYHIEPVRQVRVIVRKPLAAVVQAHARYSARPLHDVSYSTHAVHATVLLDDADLHHWWNAVPYSEPGALLFWNKREE